MRKIGTSASSTSARGVKHVDLQGRIGKAEYERLVEPILANARKRKAERMEAGRRQMPRVRMGTVYRWTPAALASYESSTMQGGESADLAPGYKTG